jgi:hypothetical protein
VSIVVWYKCDILPTFNFRDVGSSDCNRWHCTPHSNFRAVQEMNMGFLWVFIWPVLQVLLIKGAMEYNAPRYLLDSYLIFQPSFSETDDKTENSLSCHGPLAVVQYKFCNWWNLWSLHKMHCTCLSNVSEGWRSFSWPTLDCGQQVPTWRHVNRIKLNRPLHTSNQTFLPPFSNHRGIVFKKGPSHCLDHQQNLCTCSLTFQCSIVKWTARSLLYVHHIYSNVLY